MNTKELQKIVKFCRKNGIKRLKTAEIEIEISQDFTPQPRATRSDQPIIQIAREEAERMPSDDEMLMWASPAYDDIREQRKA